MFGTAKSDIEKKVASISEEVLDIKNQRKLSELDFEKRILLLEDAVNTVNKTVGSSKNLKDMKENLEHIIDVQEKIRELEDRQLIDRLETMQGQDTLHVIESNVDKISRKFELLSEAVKIIGTKSGGVAPAHISGEKFEAGQKDLDALKAEISAMRAEKLDKQDVAQIEVRVALSEKAAKELERGFSELASSVRETIRKRENDLSAVQKKISEFEGISSRTDSVEGGLNMLREADKKIEALVSSLRNQVSLADGKHSSELERIRSEFDEEKKAFEESLRAQNEAYEKKLEDANAAMSEDMKKDIRSIAARADATENELDAIRAQEKSTSSALETVHADIEAVKSGTDAATRKAREEQMKKAEELRASFESEIKNVLDSFSSLEQSHESLKGEFDEARHGLERKIAKSTEEALKKQSQMYEGSMSALKESSKRMDKVGRELDSAIASVNANYRKVCTALGSRDVKEVVKHVEEIRKYEERIKKEILSEMLVKSRDIVEEELKDVTSNLKRISDLALKKEIGPEEIEHIVENKLAAFSADYNRLGKALGTLQRIVQQGHAGAAQTAKQSMDEEIKPMKDELADMREDIEHLKTMRGDLVDDINKIIAGYEAKRTAEAPPAKDGAFAEDRMRTLEDLFNRRISEIEAELDKRYSLPVPPAEPEIPHDIEGRLLALGRQNEALRAELEELKDAYFRIVKLQQGSPVIIE